MARWTFEPGHTAAEFRARHMMVTYVRGAFKNVHGTLDFDGAANGINCTWKFNQSPITCGFDDTAAIVSNLGIDQIRDGKP